MLLQQACVALASMFTGRVLWHSKTLIQRLQRIADRADGLVQSKERGLLVVTENKCRNKGHKRTYLPTKIRLLLYLRNIFSFS